jgi:hypothetical protein
LSPLNIVFKVDERVLRNAITLKQLVLDRSSTGVIGILDFGGIGEPGGPQQVATPGFGYEEPQQRLPETYDIFAFGAVAHFLLEGREPLEHWPKIPITNVTNLFRLRRLVYKCMKESERERPRWDEIIRVLLQMVQSME